MAFAARALSLRGAQAFGRRAPLISGPGRFCRNERPFFPDAVHIRSSPDVLIKYYGRRWRGENQTSSRPPIGPAGSFHEKGT